jgi:hypothetical protein
MGDELTMGEANVKEQLDRQLREAMPYINDNGFTARVLRQLPQPRRQRQSLRTVILLGMTMLASVLAYVLSDSGRFVSIGVERLSMLPMVWLFALALGSGILVTAVGVVAALSKADELAS